ncbi:Asp23/Gls24 family envelope stress response protein [Microlunatus antarcticus]|uniref:Putative alkaline shock family protein YloU n=1 Tax=Microlunatus antarcticus TaxID=53388 RepID=A0A7W5P7B3_9ACTN|nr:putative alkaline shock family protein YloU [Microlunatus antarcticus]
MTQTTSPVRLVGDPAPASGAPTSPAARVQDSATRAATQVEGVHALGSPGGRALVRALGRVPGGRPFYGSGVSVEVGPQAVALDVSLVLEYGAQAVDVANRVRSAVDAAVAQETGLDVVEVNVTVADVHHPADDVAPEPEPEPEPSPEQAEEDPLDALPVDLEKADPASWSDAPTTDTAKTDATADSDASAPTQQDDDARTVVVVESGDAGRSSSDGPQVVTADEVVIADRVVVVGDADAEPSSK